MLIQSVDGPSYLPCAASISSLSPLHLLNVRLETRSRDRALIHRTFRISLRMQVTQIGIEGFAAVSDRLALNSFNPAHFVL